MSSVASIVSSLLSGAGLGVALHEFSHSIVARTYGASTLEVGLIFPLIPGGYIVINEASIKDRSFKRLLVLGAGIECNALLAVLLLFIGALEKQHGQWLCEVDLNGKSMLTCSLCGYIKYHLTNTKYCEHCGCQMQSAKKITML